MAINYSLCRIKLTGKNEGTEKFYMRAQSHRTVSVEEVMRYAAEHYGKPFDANDMRKMMAALHQTIIDMLKDGNRVSLGELGTFYCHLDSKSLTAEELADKKFRPSYAVNDVNIKWNPSKELDSLKYHGDVEYKECAQVRQRKAKIRE